MLRDEHEAMDETEVSAITHDIMQNSHTITNIIDNWMRTLALEGIDKVERNDDISCNCNVGANFSNSINFVNKIINIIFSSHSF